MKGTLHKDHYTFFIISRSFHLRMRYVGDKCCTENQNTHFVFSSFFENPAIYVIMWKNFVEQGKPQMKIRRMCIACWIPEATNTHQVCVILIAFPLQLLHSYASLNCITVLSNHFHCRVLPYVYIITRLTLEFKSPTMGILYSSCSLR